MRHVTALLAWNRLPELLSNLVLALLYFVFLRIFLANFLAYGRLSSLLLAIVETFFIYFALTRRSPHERAAAIGAWLSAFVGSFLPLLLRPATGDETLAGEAIQVVGAFLIGYSILSLGRSFGLVAANRGVVTWGMYRFVRHPLYLSYAVHLAGFLINNFNAANALILVISVAAQVMRIQYEEKLLRGDAAYCEYARATRWRLLPYVY